MIYAYHGRSMWPTFQEGDLLIVEQVDPSQLRRGDCIVFRTAPNVSATIHRIVKMHPHICSRGDSHAHLDDEPIAPESVFGCVRALMRNGGQRGVRGGWLGLLGGRIAYYAGLLDPYNNSRGGRLARLLARLCGLVTRLWLRRAKTVVVSGTSGSTRYLILGQKSIARWDDDCGGWVVPWPRSLYMWLGEFNEPA
jgi:hypothetical protein